MLLILCIYREINDTKKYLYLHAGHVDRRRTYNEAQQKSSLTDHHSDCGYAITCIVAAGAVQGFFRG
jgi:hypothetical protein